EIVGLAELLRGERRGPAELWRQAHDVAALGVDRDEQFATRARRRLACDRAREAGQLIGVDDVAAEGQHASDPQLAQQPGQIRVPGCLRSTESDEEERAQLALDRGETGIGCEDGPAARGEEDTEKASGGQA